MFNLSAKSPCITKNSLAVICWVILHFGISLVLCPSPCCICSLSQNRVPLKPVLETWAVLHHYITAHEQTQLTRVCYFRFLDYFLASREYSFKTYICTFIALFYQISYLCYGYFDNFISLFLPSLNLNRIILSNDFIYQSVYL